MFNDLLMFSELRSNPNLRFGVVVFGNGVQTFLNIKFEPFSDNLLARMQTILFNGVEEGRFGMRKNCEKIASFADERASTLSRCILMWYYKMLHDFTAIKGTVLCTVYGTFQNLIISCRLIVGVYYSQHVLV